VVCKSQFWCDEVRRIVHPEASEDTIFAMIKVYLDESGIHDDAAICTVAGYAASWKKWKRFIKAWQRVLKQFGLLEVGFHAQQFFARAGKEYRGWTPADTTDCFDRLIATINVIKACPVGSCLIVDVFRRLNVDERRYLTGARYDMSRSKWLTSGAPETPYHLPIQQVVVDAAHLASPSKKAHFVHDQQKQYGPLVLERFSELRNILAIKECLGDIVFSPRLEAVPLQAADLIAFVATKYAEARLATGNPRIAPSYEFRRVMERPNNIRFLDENGIALLLDGCPTALRTSLIATRRGRFDHLRGRIGR
jgi:hypothetical protein